MMSMMCDDCSMMSMTCEDNSTGASDTIDNSDVSSLQDHNKISKAPASGSAATSSARQKASFNKNQQDNSSIYRCPISIRCHANSFDAFSNPVVDSCSSTDVARIRASILFNLGLAHHMLAENTTQDWISESSYVPSTFADAGTDKDMLLEKAATIYKLSLSLQASEQASISTAHIIAICNNIGQCYSSLHQESKSKIWNERLLRLLMCQQQHQHQKIIQGFKQILLYKTICL
jgi:hypothetical protein